MPDANVKPLGPPRVYVGSGDGKIRVFAFDATSAALPGADGRLREQSVFPRRKPRTKVPLRHASDMTVTVLPSSSTTSTLEPGFTGQNTTAEIQLTPDGQHVIASNRGDNSLTVFDVNASDGKLTRTASS